MEQRWRVGTGGNAIDLHSGDVDAGRAMEALMAHMFTQDLLPE